MGLFNTSEEEFLDPDEIRLRRESEARRRGVHKDCVADHSDDYTSPIHPANNTRPHNDCHADHRDDNYKPSTRNGGDKTVVVFAIIIALIFCIAGFLIPIITTFMG